MKKSEMYCINVRSTVLICSFKSDSTGMCNAVERHLSKILEEVGLCI